MGCSIGVNSLVTLSMIRGCHAGLVIDRRDVGNFDRTSSLVTILDFKTNPHTLQNPPQSLSPPHKMSDKLEFDQKGDVEQLGDVYTFRLFVPGLIVSGSSPRCVVFSSCGSRSSPGFIAWRPREHASPLVL